MSDDPARDRRRLWAIFTMPPATLETDTWVTVTYPARLDAVLSVQATGTTALAPTGAQGPSELAVLKPDRVVYAPLGKAGRAFLLAYASTLPNP